MNTISTLLFLYVLLLFLSLQSSVLTTNSGDEQKSRDHNYLMNLDWDKFDYLYNLNQDHHVERAQPSVKATSPKAKESDKKIMKQDEIMTDQKGKTKRSRGRPRKYKIPENLTQDEIRQYINSRNRGYTSNRKAKTGYHTNKIQVYNLLKGLINQKRATEEQKLQFQEMKDKNAKQAKLYRLKKKNQQ